MSPDPATAQGKPASFRQHQPCHASEKEGGKPDESGQFEPSSPRVMLLIVYWSKQSLLGGWQKDDFPKGWFWRMFPRNEAGTRVCWHVPPNETRNEGRFCQNHPFTKLPFYLMVNFFCTDIARAEIITLVIQKQLRVWVSMKVFPT